MRIFPSHEKTIMALDKPNPARNELIESLLDANPFVQFQLWFKDAQDAGILQANAMTLATASKDGKPSARIVLMKTADARGFTFFTNYRSRKGKELAENPRAALIFYWETLGRQVRIEGRVEKLTAEESDAYFNSRPLENKLSSMASPQSEPVTREELDDRYEELKRRYAHGPIPRPEQWGGYRVNPERIEFWQRRFARLNDRVAYERGEDGKWKRMRLAP
jgi:pyridoxamine 5'-phosphate oxidase